MLTVRHLEREWNTRAYGRLMRELLTARGESSPKLITDLARPAASAAMIMVRLDELGQLHAPLFTTLLRTVLAAQDAGGGWSDPLVTALAVRALRLSNGNGVAVDRGLKYLADLQKENGLWPAEPIRRLEGDPFVTAWVLFHLGGDASFRRVVQFDDALAAMELMEDAHTPEARRLWARVNRRQTVRRVAEPAAMIWS
ncbi:hypothetical protein BH10PLA1_BH10PLA1_07390 [soil metagenome]